jgi:hypothetical protein
VTSLQPRTHSAHRARMKSGKIRPATVVEFDRLKRMV